MTHDYFYCLQSHHRPVNDLSTAVQLTNRLLRFWADGGFVYYERVSTPSFLACENICFSLLFATGDVSRGETSATQRQKFHTDDVKSVRIRSEAPIGQRGSYIVLAIVYE